MRRDTSALGYTRASEASVSIYILALALSRVLLVRVYSWQNKCDLTFLAGVVHSEHNDGVVYIILCSYITLFVIYEQANLTY